MIDDGAGAMQDAARLAPEIEPHSINPDEDRSATVFDFMRVESGDANSPATAVLRPFPIMFGHSFWRESPQPWTKRRLAVHEHLSPVPAG